MQRSAKLRERAAIVFLVPSYLRQRRGRLPLVVFVLLLIVCLLLLGLACVCASDHHAQAVDRAVSGLVGLPAPIELWSLIAVAMLAVGVMGSARRSEYGHASPASLQSFLF